MNARKTPTRIGKIARLPYVIRMEVNFRIREGQLATEILTWLNAEPRVKARLDDLGFRPITSDNLSQWRHGGYEDWRAEEAQRTHG